MRDTSTHENIEQSKEDWFKRQKLDESEESMNENSVEIIDSVPSEFQTKIQAENCNENSFNANDYKIDIEEEKNLNRNKMEKAIKKKKGSCRNYPDVQGTRRSRLVCYSFRD